MFACPFLQGFSEHWVDYTSDFPLLPLPKLQQQHIPNHPKLQAKIFFSGKPFLRDNDSSKGWGEHLPALSAEAQAHAPQHYRYLRISHFCSWLPFFSHQNILLLLRTMFAFSVMPNAPSSFPVFRKIIQKAAQKVRGDGQKNIPFTLFEVILITSTLQSQQPQLGKNCILAHRILFWHNTLRGNISSCNWGELWFTSSLSIYTPVVCALGCSL